MHSICESETGFDTPSKPARETVSLRIHMFVLIAMDEITIKSMPMKYLFCDKYITFYDVDKLKSNIRTGIPYMKQ